MSTSGEAEIASVQEPVVEVPATGQPAEKVVKEKKAKAKKAAAPKEKKPKAAKTASHPPYFQMIKEAILALKEKSGSSPYAIAKYMEEKHKAVLPANFRKILGLQLKNSASKGKLIKVKASYKLSESGKADKAATAASKPAKAAGATKKAAPAKAKAVTKGAAKVEAKAASKKPVGLKRKAEAVVKKKGGSAVKSAKKAKKMTPAKAKQPKSIKSPAKRTKKVAA